MKTILRNAMVARLLPFIGCAAILHLAAYSADKATQQKIPLEAQVAASEARARVKCPDAFKSGTALQSAMYDVAFHFDRTKPGWRNKGDWPEQLIEIITHYSPRPEWHAARMEAERKQAELKLQKSDAWDKQYWEQAQKARLEREKRSAEVIPPGLAIPGLDIPYQNQAQAKVQQEETAQRKIAAQQLVAVQPAAREAVQSPHPAEAKSSTKSGFDPTTAKPTGFEDLGAVTEQPEPAEKTAESAQVNTSGPHPPSSFNAQENPVDGFQLMVIIVCAVLFPITVIAAYKAIAARNDTAKLSTPDISTHALREQQPPDSSVLIEMVNAKVRHYRRRSNICFVIAVVGVVLLYASGGLTTKDEGTKLLIGIVCLPLLAMLFAAFVYAAKCRGRSWAWALLVPVASFAVGSAGPVVAGRVGFWIGTLIFCLAMWLLPKRTEAMLTEARASLGSQLTPGLQKAAENFLSKMDRKTDTPEPPQSSQEGPRKKLSSYIWWNCPVCKAENCSTEFFSGTRKPCCNCGGDLVVPGSRPDNEEPSQDREGMEGVVLPVQTPISSALSNQSKPSLRERIAELQQLLDAGQITPDEFAEHKARILKEI